MNYLFGARLKALRKQKKLSQSKLGKAVGVHYNQIGRYELGRTIPSGPVLAALSKVLEISIDSLLSETEPIPSSVAPVRTVDAAVSEKNSKEPTRSGHQAASSSLQPIPSDESAALRQRFDELAETCRGLSPEDLRTVIAVLEAFVLRARVSDLHIGR
jgi:transcriptional regulator with XRE-family HTH domain